VSEKYLSFKNKEDFQAWNGTSFDEKKNYCFSKYYSSVSYLGNNQTLIDHKNIYNNWNIKNLTLPYRPNRREDTNYCVKFSKTRQLLNDVEIVCNNQCESPLLEFRSCIP
jgi:hypothetical protein